MSNITNSRSFLRGSGLAVGLAAGVMLSLSFAAWANHGPIKLDTKTTFTDGDPITALPFNRMFNELYAWAEGTDENIAALQTEVDQIAALQAQVAALQPFTPCGETQATNGGFGGYAEGKLRCKTAMGCSDAAHMCTSDEILQHFNAGGDLNGFSYGWVSSGVMSPSSINTFVNDCVGWTDITLFGSAWSPNGSPSFAACNSQHPILCCDI